MAPPITVASEQKATTWVPSTLPTAASMPLPSSAVISSRVPSSKNAASRLFGFRGSCSRGSLTFFGGAAGAAGAWVMRCCLSDGGEGDGDVGAAEAERVVEGHEVAGRQVTRLGGDVEVDGRVLVVEVDRRRHDPVVYGEHGRQRLEGAGPTEQVAGHRLGAGDHDVGGGLSERRVDHQALGDVALRGRRRVRVDVLDVLGGEVAL